MKLKVFDICREGTHVLGPGNRYVIWTQGCPHKCPGCITPESHDPEDGIELDSNDIAADIILNEKIQGITVSGGEPFLQASSLTKLLGIVREYRPELTVIIYTGYRLSELHGVKDGERLMELADVIIDGRYISSEDDNRGIRGSRNQKIHHLTPRLKAFEEFMETCERKQSRILIREGQCTKIGVPEGNGEVKNE